MFYPLLAGHDVNTPTEGRRRRGSRDSKWPIACASSGLHNDESIACITEAQSISDYSLDGFDDDTTTTTSSDEDETVNETDFYDQDDDDDDYEDDDNSNISVASSTTLAISMYWKPLLKKMY